MPTGRKLLEKIRQYHFQLKHVLVLFIVLVTAQLLISLVQKVSLENLLVETQDSYQEDSVERVANLTAISLELLLETLPHTTTDSEEERRAIVEAFNIILSQQLLLQDVEEVCVLVSDENKVFAIDNGRVLYDYFWGNVEKLPMPDKSYQDGINLYRQLKEDIKTSEEIHSILQGKQTFHVFVPFVPKGEYAGAVYMKNSPDFSFLTKEVISSYNKSSLIFTGLILFGLLAMFYISSYSVRERDEAQELLFQERENQIEERVHYQKEALFAKRIYHTHHKAEKIMGFIKEDVREISKKNIESIKYRVTKYANFISRVIYDMKWFEPPIQTVRNPIFKTDLNEVIRFVVENVCLRNTRQSQRCHFDLKLDNCVPRVHVNEFVIWEILEPLFQNSIDHNVDSMITITVKTMFCREKKETKIVICDNGIGIAHDLLIENDNGIKPIFLENISTKRSESNTGYGCYLAYEISKERCGWDLDVENLQSDGCKFTITIPAQSLPG